jgi:hypothetical protein
MVEVFKTNVHCPEAAANLLALLRVHYGGCQVSFDLEDCDKVLRIAGQRVVVAPQVISILQQQGFQCLVLDY